MRLLYLDSSDRPRFEERGPDHAYVILSHTWGHVSHEVHYQDILDGTYDIKKGYEKLKFCLREASHRGLRYVWMDSCCIDQSNAVEISEAVNQMFHYYSEAELCLVYLEDIAFKRRHYFTDSRWFTRGWTLQELVAAKSALFFSTDHQLLGDRSQLAPMIEARTGINVHQDLSQVHPVDKYKWSFARVTSKAEDVVYSVVGLLKITLMPVYGEGVVKARDRLIQAVRDEYGRQTADQMIEAWLLHRHKDEMNAAREPTAAIEILLRSLRYDGMYAKQRRIRQPTKFSCDWILSHPSFLTWNEMDDCRRLHLQSKLGAGKSVLIKFLAAHIKATGRLTCSYHFDEDGKAMDRNGEGLYRTLIHQLLEQSPLLEHWLIDEVKSWYSLDWTLETLRDTFRTLVHHAVESRQCPVTIFVDGIDESLALCRQDLIEDLADLSHWHSVSVCFSSRLYPVVWVPSSIDICIDHEIGFQQGVETIVRQGLELEDDRIREQLVRTITSRSQGCVLWTVLIMRVLNMEAAAGRMYRLRDVLDTLPTKINKVLERIVSHSESDYNEFKFSLRWILFAARPLRSSEYYSAMTMSLEELGMLESAQGAVHQYYAPQSASAKFISSSSRGLAESWDEHDTEGDQVQLIHDCVRIFLLGPTRSTSGLFEHKFLEGESHDAIKIICLQALTSILHNPLTRYAIQNTLIHADRALSLGVTQGSFLDELNGSAYQRHSTDIDVFTGPRWHDLENEELRTLRSWLEKIHLCMVAKTFPLLVEAGKRMVAQLKSQCPLKFCLSIQVWRTVSTIQTSEQSYDAMKDVADRINRDLGLDNLSVHYTRATLPLRPEGEYLLILHHNQEQILLALVGQTDEASNSMPADPRFLSQAATTQAVMDGRYASGVIHSCSSSSSGMPPRTAYSRPPRRTIAPSSAETASSAQAESLDPASNARGSSSRISGPSNSNRASSKARQ